ncbi:hypothetical protein AAC387_Pa05g1027 [Persea americana]
MAASWDLPHLHNSDVHHWDQRRRQWHVPDWTHDSPSPFHQSLAKRKSSSRTVHGITRLSHSHTKRQPLIFLLLHSNSVVPILHASLQIARHSCFCISLRSLISVAVGISYLGLKSWDFFSEIDLGGEEGAGLEGII